MPRSQPECNGGLYTSVPRLLTLSDPVMSHRLHGHSKEPVCKLSNISEAALKKLVWAIAICTLLPSTVFAQSVPRLTQGMPYVQARKMILSAGWQASISNPMHKDELQQVLQKWFIQRGFLEVSGCMPTGLGLCSTVFHNAQGQKLFVDTSEPEPFPKIVSWCLNRQGC